MRERKIVPAYMYEYEWMGEQRHTVQHRSTEIERKKERERAYDREKYTEQEGTIRSLEWSFACLLKIIQQHQTTTIAHFACVFLKHFTLIRDYHLYVHSLAHISRALSLLRGSFFMATSYKNVMSTISHLFFSHSLRLMSNGGWATIIRSFLLLHMRFSLGRLESIQTHTHIQLHTHTNTFHALTAIRSARFIRSADVDAQTAALHSMSHRPDISAFKCWLPIDPGNADNISFRQLFKLVSYSIWVRLYTFSW